MGPFRIGKQLVIVFGVSVGDPDEVLDRECREAYGSAYERVLPYQDPYLYEAAYDLVTQNLGSGEAMTVLDRNNARVTFFTPNRLERAWSGWIRVVDVSKFSLN